MSALTDTNPRDEDRYPAGIEVFFWNGKGEVKYATVQSSFTRPDEYGHSGPVVLLVVKMQDERGTITCVPSTAVTIVEASPICSPLPIIYRLLSKL